MSATEDGNRLPQDRTTDSAYPTTSLHPASAPPTDSLFMLGEKAREAKRKPRRQIPHAPHRQLLLIDEFNAETPATEEGPRVCDGGGSIRRKSQGDVLSGALRTAAARHTHDTYCLPRGSAHSQRSRSSAASSSSSSSSSSGNDGGEHHHHNGGRDDDDSSSDPEVSRGEQSSLLPPYFHKRFFEPVELQVESLSSFVVYTMLVLWYAVLAGALVVQVIPQSQWTAVNLCGTPRTDSIHDFDSWGSTCVSRSPSNMTPPAGSSEPLADLMWSVMDVSVMQNNLHRFQRFVVSIPVPDTQTDDAKHYTFVSQISFFAFNSWVRVTIPNETTCKPGKKRCSVIRIPQEVVHRSWNDKITVELLGVPAALADAAERGATFGVFFQKRSYSLAAVAWRYIFILISFIHLMRFVAARKFTSFLFEQKWVLFHQIALLWYLDPLYAINIVTTPQPSVLAFIEYRVPVYFLAITVGFMFAVMTASMTWRPGARRDSSALVRWLTRSQNVYDPPMWTKIIPCVFVAAVFAVDVADFALHNGEIYLDSATYTHYSRLQWAAVGLLGFGGLVCLLMLFYLHNYLGKKPYLESRPQQLACRVFLLVFTWTVLYWVFDYLIYFLYYNNSFAGTASIQPLVQIPSLMVSSFFVNIMTLVYTNRRRSHSVPVAANDPRWKRMVWPDTWYRWLSRHGGSQYIFFTEREEMKFYKIQFAFRQRQFMAKQRRRGRLLRGLPHSDCSSFTSNMTFGSWDDRLSDAPPQEKHRPTAVSMGKGGRSGGLHDPAEYQTNSRPNASFDSTHGGVPRSRTNVDRSAAERKAANTTNRTSSGGGATTANDPKEEHTTTPDNDDDEQQQSQLSPKLSAERPHRATTSVPPLREEERGILNMDRFSTYYLPATPVARGSSGHHRDYEEGSSLLHNFPRTARGGMNGSLGGGTADGFDQSDTRDGAGEQPFRGHVRRSQSAVQLRQTSPAVMNSSADFARSFSLEVHGSLRPHSRTGASSFAAPRRHRRTRSLDLHPTSVRFAKDSALTASRTTAPEEPPLHSSMRGGRRDKTSSPRPSPHTEVRPQPSFSLKRGHSVKDGDGGGTASEASQDASTRLARAPLLVRTFNKARERLGNILGSAEEHLVTLPARKLDQLESVLFDLAYRPFQTVSYLPFFNLETAIDCYNMSWEAYGVEESAGDTVIETGLKVNPKNVPKSVTHGVKKFFGGCCPALSSSETENDDTEEDEAGERNHGGKAEASEEDSGHEEAQTPKHVQEVRYQHNASDSPESGGGATARVVVSPGESQGAQPPHESRSRASSAAPPPAPGDSGVLPINVEKYGFTRLLVMQVKDVQVLVVRMDDKAPEHAGKAPRIIIAFRGTANLSNAKHDLKINRVVWPEMERNEKELHNHSFASTVLSSVTRTRCFARLRACLKRWRKKTSWRPTVHAGFLSIWKAARRRVTDKVLETLREDPDTVYRIFTTGHSLGGALASLCAYSLTQTLLQIEYPITDVTVYTYGQPRLGNRTFRTIYNKAVPRSFRLMNESDVVVTMTMFGGYHVGITVNIDRNGNIIVKPTDIEKIFPPTKGRGFSLMNHLMSNYGISLNAIATRTVCAARCLDFYTTADPAKVEAERERLAADSGSPHATADKVKKKTSEAAKSPASPERSPKS